MPPPLYKHIGFGPLADTRHVLQRLRTCRRISGCRRPIGRDSRFSFRRRGRNHHSQYHTQDRIRAYDVVSLAATCGFCEELVFRGYLTQQFSAWTGSRVLAVVLQGVVFGLAHGYYHWVMVAQWSKAGCGGCLPTGARACARGCWPTAYKMLSVP